MSAAALEVKVERLEISAGEKKDLVDLVAEQQSARMTRRLSAAEVPKILLPYQTRWHADPAPVRFCSKSRRIGFSWACLAAEGALEAARTGRSGMSQYYMGYNLGMAAENIGDALTFSRAYGLAAGELSELEMFRERETIVDPVLGERRQDITRYKLSYRSGHVYEALSSAPWNWRGRQGHARIDEAAYHNSLKEVVKGAMAFLMWGGRVDIVSSENGEDNDFFEYERDILQGKLGWSAHYIDFDQALAEGFYRRVCLVTGKNWSAEAEAVYRAETFASYPDQDDAAEELLRIPRRGSGAYFSRMLMENCMIDGVPVIAWSMPANFVVNPDRIAITKTWIADNLTPLLHNLTPHRAVYGQDFGRDADLSDTWVMQERQPLRWTQAFIVELRRIPFDCQALIRDTILDALRPWLHHAAFDARGNGQSHAEGALQKLGALLVTCVKATAQFYDEWFPKYRNAYEGKNFLVAKDEDIVTDHRRVKLAKGRPTMDDGRDKGKDGEWRHGDGAIGGLMAYVATCAPASAIDYLPLPARHTGWDGAAKSGEDFMRAPEEDDEPVLADGGW